MRAPHQPDDDPADTGTGESPGYADRFDSGFGVADPMVAAGNQYLIVSDIGGMAFFDKQGEPLSVKNGMPTSMGFKDFFAGFIAKTNDDGSLNESNINLYLGVPKACDSPDYPETYGNRFCVGEFYDPRVTFDATSKRFFVIAQARHPLWNNSAYGYCGYYSQRESDVADKSKCAIVKKGKCNTLVTSTETCDLTRRYLAFAVSKTEDPRDGFHQYMVTQSNHRDWPWMAVNGNHFVTAHRGEYSTHTGEGEEDSAVATVFSVQALKSGEQHPPYFLYRSKSVDGVKSVLPATHHQNATGLTYLLGRSKGTRLDIFAFPQTSDPWTAPTLLKTSVNLSTDKPKVVGAVYRQGRIYLVDGKLVEVGGRAARYSIRVVRIPVEKLGASLIKASSDPSKGFLDVAFGRNATSDAKGDRLDSDLLRSRSTNEATCCLVTVGCRLSARTR